MCSINGKREGRKREEKAGRVLEVDATQCQVIRKDLPSKVTCEQGPEGSETELCVIWGKTHSRHKE